VVADTVNVYAVPLDNPVTVHDLQCWFVRSIMAQTSGRDLRPPPEGVRHVGETGGDRQRGSKSLLRSLTRPPKEEGDPSNGSAKTARGPAALDGTSALPSRKRQWYR